MTAPALFSAALYAETLAALLPPGRVWNTDLQRQVMAGFAPSFERLDARAQQLLVDAFPSTTTELMPEWEATLGLPDDCEGADQTVEQRRAQIIARFCANGGQTIGYYLQVLETLGYTNATVEEFAPFQVGHASVGMALLDEDWWHVWNINLPDVREFDFRAGESAVGEALATFSDTSVFCVIDALKPAHTYVTYSFDPA